MPFKMKYKRSAFPFKDTEGTGAIESEQKSAETDATSKMEEVTPGRNIGSDGRNIDFQKDQRGLSYYSGQQDRGSNAGIAGVEAKGVAEGLSKSQQVIAKTKWRQAMASQRGDYRVEGGYSGEAKSTNPWDKAYNPSLDAIKAKNEPKENGREWFKRIFG